MSGRRSTNAAAPDASPGIAASYRRLLAEPVLRRLAAADVCARLPQGMMSITVLLVAAQHAPMGVAGLALAGYTLGAAATAPVRGRLADRRGLLPVAAVCGIGYVLAMLGLLAASLARAPAGLLVSAAAAAGLVLPPVSPGVRSLWSAYAEPGLRQAAFALDAAVYDLSFITGPVLASVLAAGLAPAAALVLVLALTWASIVAVGAHARPPGRRDDRPGRRDDRHERRAPGPMRSAALRRLLVTAALTNVALSATEVSLTAYARDHDALWASGPLLAAVSAGSIAGSLLLGARRPPSGRASAPVPAGSAGPRPGAAAEAGGGCGARAAAGRAAPRGGSTRRLPRPLARYALGLAGLTAGLTTGRGGYSRRLPRLLAGYALGLAGLTAASLYGPLLGVAAPLAGLCLGPALATLFSAVGSAAPSGTSTEAQAWINSIMNGGAAGGAALAGLTASRPVLGLALAAGAAAAAAASAAATGRRPGRVRA